MPDNETFIDLFPDADPEATARPPQATDSLDPRQVLDRLPRWQDDALEMRKTLGEGGMGIVRLAHQPALGRDVAVKTLRRAHRTEGARWQVLQEAWAAGSLEHPHIVPVYGLGLDEADMPYIVLKRLEGDRWTDRLRGADTTMVEHLRILERVAQAVAYAHDRGVLHRDLKPDNVMIGSYDEVTVIDWGLAVTTRDTPDRRLPRASDQHFPAGTPAYMATEQLAEDGARPSPQTDVYLLGGLLYRILVGRSPHGKGRLEVVIDHVRQGLPELDDDGIDAEARALLRRAMARAPADRHPDGGAFLTDLRAYRTHFGARVLLRQADLHADALLAELATEEPRKQVVQQELGACRFGYLQARKEWPQAPIDRLDQLLRHMVRFHLDRDEPGAASVVAAELADDALTAEVGEALARRDASRAAAERLAVDTSAATGIRTRSMVFFLVGGAWVVAPVLVTLFLPTPETVSDGYGWAHGANLLLFLLVSALSIWAAESLGRSQMNRYLRGQLFGVCGIQFLVLLVSQTLGVDLYEAVAHMQLAWMAMAVCNLALVGWVMLPTVVAFASAYAGSMFYPSSAVVLLGAANVVLLLNVFVPWGPLLVEAWRETD